MLGGRHLMVKRKSKCTEGKASDDREEQFIMLRGKASDARKEEQMEEE
jgi:hypothetical protein